MLRELLTRTEQISDLRDLFRVLGYQPAWEPVPPGPWLGLVDVWLTRLRPLGHARGTNSVRSLPGVPFGCLADRGRNLY